MAPQWEAEQAAVTPEEVNASIDRKVESIRAEVEAKQAVAWAKLSEETREAWARFVALRTRDLDAAAADEAARALVDVGPMSKVWPNMEPPGPRKPPPPAVPKTRWTVMDESFEP